MPSCRGSFQSRNQTQVSRIAGRFFTIWDTRVGLSSITQSSPTVCDPMDCSMPSFPALHYLLELAQTHVHWVCDANQPSCPLYTIQQVNAICIYLRDSAYLEHTHQLITAKTQLILCLLEQFLNCLKAWARIRHLHSIPLPKSIFFFFK